jgi:nitroimidazol reductase NimA-like FMN-containing flavoprotein (pyridoxamine 5'-phosphate oxidase superfamily)
MNETAVRILKEQWFCVIGTASTAAEPWVTPVFFNHDPSYRFVWESSRHSHHSQLIAANPAIAIVVANFARQEADEAVYLNCTAREVPPEGLAEALEVFLNGVHPRKTKVERNVEMYVEDQQLRLYEARPESAYLLVATYDEEGRRVDRRQAIDLIGA